MMIIYVEQEFLARYLVGLSAAEDGGQVRGEWECGGSGKLFQVMPDQRSVIRVN
jgi:hypothetical protein